MATPNVGILTNAGKNLIDQVNAGQTKITFSKIVFSSMNNNQLTDDQIKALTTVAPQEIVVNNPKVTLDNNTGETRIRATGNNEALDDGVYVKTYAVYAKDDSGHEILYGITVSPNPNYLPEYDGVTPQAVTYSYKVNISNTSNITFTNSNDVYVSDTDLAEALQPYAKTVDVNQQLAKKVNIADMRKPASDVAGIEEVNTKQDRIGYTPADDSKVVHSTDASNWQKQALFNPRDYKIDAANSDTDFATLLRNKYNKAGVVYIRENDETTIDAVVICEGDNWWYAYGITMYGNFVHRRIRESDDTGWIANADDSEVVHSTVTELNSTDMNTVKIAGFYLLRSGTNRIPNGDDHTIYQVIPFYSSNGVQLAYGTNNAISGMRSWNSYNRFTSWVQFADDSKVAHLSGANNFDTVPTVNNNPLLLASSLPSDLARTGQDTNFTGKLQKSGIDVATTTDVKNAVNTATANMADTTKATNFTAGLQSGGVDVATAADLKSVEDSAWRELDLSETSGLYKGKINIKIDDSEKNIYVMGNLSINDTTATTSRKNIIDLSKIVKSITACHGYLIGYLEDGTDPYDISGSTSTPQGACITNESGLNNEIGVNRIVFQPDPGKDLFYVDYDQLI